MTLRYNRLRNATSIVTRARLNRSSASIPLKDLEVVSVALKAMKRYLESLGENVAVPGEPIDLMAPQDLYDGEIGAYGRVDANTPLWIPTRINGTWSEWRIHIGDARPVSPSTTVRYIRKGTSITPVHVHPDHAINSSNSAKASALLWEQSGSSEDILYYCVKEG